MRSSKQSVLILYTGGTIGMSPTESGLTPCQGFEIRLREYLDRHIHLNLPSWEFLELLPPIDSGNITPTHWLRLRETIVEAVRKRDVTGVLILHGTDTLAYSAAALSFQLLGLEVPVVLTGALLPADAAESDAWENVIGSLQALARGLLPGVYLYFHGDLLRGTRCSKIRSCGRNPFAAPPFMEKREAVKPQGLPPALRYEHPKVPSHIAVMPLFPGISATHLAALIESGIQGLVLECYGVGTGPCNDEAFLTVLRTAAACGIILLAVSQCWEDKIQWDLYEAGSRLCQAGLLSGGRMTREAAIGKLHALIGAGFNREEIAYWLQQDLCGELF